MDTDCGIGWVGEVRCKRHWASSLCTTLLPFSLLFAQLCATFCNHRTDGNSPAQNWDVFQYGMERIRGERAWLGTLKVVLCTFFTPTNWRIADSHGIPTLLGWKLFELLQWGVVSVELLSNSPWSQRPACVMLKRRLAKGMLLHLLFHLLRIISGHYAIRFHSFWITILKSSSTLTSTHCL